MPEKKPRITAKLKFDIYLQTRGKDAPVGEILRKYGLHLSDLKQIEESVENGALSALKTRSSSKKMLSEVSPQEHIALQKELERKDKALADLTVEYTLLKKNDR